MAGISSFISTILLHHFPRHLANTFPGRIRREMPQ